MRIATALLRLLPWQTGQGDEPVLMPPGRPRLLVPTDGDVPHDSLAGQGAQLGWELPEGHHVVGSAREADLVLTDPTVAPAHAELVVEADGTTSIRQIAGSLQVDGRPVAHALLVDGSRVMMGGAVLVFRSDDV
ncbi:MAG: FHA domain-containing protein [Mycobacteriales bacterium]